MAQRCGGFKSVFLLVLVIGILIYLIPLFIENSNKSSRQPAAERVVQKAQALPNQVIDKEITGSADAQAGAQISDSSDLLKHVQDQEMVAMSTDGRRALSSSGISGRSGTASLSNVEEASTSVLLPENDVQHEGQAGGLLGAIANPVMSDEEVLAGINAHQAQQQQIQDVLSEREEQIAVIHEAIVSAGAESSASPEIIPSAEPESFTDTPKENEIPRDFVVRAGGPSL